MSWAQRLRRFLSEEAKSAAFWWAIFLPSTGAGFYIAVAYLTGPIGPSVVIGATVTFAILMAATMMRERARYFAVARTAVEQGKPLAELLPKKQLKGPPPVLNVALHDGKEVVLIVQNTGGPGVVKGQGQILSVTGDRAVHKRKHPFGVVWQNPDTPNKRHAGPSYEFSADSTAQIRIAEYALIEGLMNASRHLLVHGDQQYVEDVQLSEYGNDKVAIAIRITLTNERENVATDYHYKIVNNNKSFVLQAEVATS
jgi:hypothetical protein